MNQDYMISMLSPKQEEILKAVMKQMKKINCFECQGAIFKGTRWKAALEFAYNNPMGGDFYVWLQDNYKQID